MKQKAFAFMEQSRPQEEREVVLEEELTQALLGLMASALLAVVAAAAEVSDAG